MKLDNIIYDVESLAAAIQEQWNNDSETFKAIFPSDTATALVNGFAAYGAMLQYMLVSAMANCYTDTAFSEMAIYQLANTLGNDLHGNNSAQVKVTLTKTNFKGINTIIPAETSFEIAGKKFFNTNAIIIPSNNNVVKDIILTQGEILEANFTTSGIPGEKFYFSSDFKANNNLIKVFVNGQEWAVADSFLPFDKNYVLDSSVENIVVLKTDPDGQSYIKLGDNQLGALPSSGSNIQIRYVSNEGADGNMSETNIYGTLLTPLIYTDNFGNQDTLNLEVITTSTAYGGFNKQSLETLRQTSPYIFASGHRAIRRQDYNALLQNKCGYLTSQVWGEYEEANKIGAYDAIMMNMVYYTGLKSFETYPYFEIGQIENPETLESALYSSRGFWGSYSIKIENLKNTTSYVTLQDIGAKGQLFINENHLDPRDSMLPDWISSTENKFKITLPENYIATSGINYSVNDKLILSNTTKESITDEIILNVKEIDVNGEILQVDLLTHYATLDWSTIITTPFITEYKEGSETGSGFTLNLDFESVMLSDMVKTNDNRDEYSEPYQENPILNARSDKINGKKTYYQSLYEPTLLNPVQIIITYPNANTGIAGIKLKASDPKNGPFPGTLAMFGTNNPDAVLENIRNSKDWDLLIPRTTLNTPRSDINDGWTDWIPTNAFTQKMNISGQPEYKKYQRYVIEFYSCEDTDGLKFVTLDSIKMLYDKDSSVIYYEDNSKVSLHFPIAGSPGPESSEGYLTSDLFGSAEYPLYNYETTISGVTSANGYRNGNILAYVFNNLETNKQVTFIIKVVNVDNATYTVTINNSEILTGNEVINTSTPVPLDANPTYSAIFEPVSGRIPLDNSGEGYKVNDIVELDGTNGLLRAKVVSVDNNGGVLVVVWDNNFSVNEDFGPEAGEDYKSYTTTLVSSMEESHGHGLVINITSKLNSGDGITPGAGGTISIKTNNNLKVAANFVGNRIDSQDINYLDQPIISEFNHFTTFLEFKQPEITPVSISAIVSLDITASITSGIIIQNIKNNIHKLFEITPDYMGKGLKISDIYTCIMNTPNVKWCKVITPTDNIDIKNNNIMILSDVEIIESIEEFK